MFPCHCEGPKDAQGEQLIAARSKSILSREKNIKTVLLFYAIFQRVTVILINNLSLYSHR